MLTITLLGTAATMPLPDRALTAAVAECGGHSLLFDCGEGTQTAARRAGVNLMKMDAICLTHYHGDHIFGLPGLLQTLGCQGRTRPLALYGPKGLGEVWAALRVLTGPLPYLVCPEVLDAPAALCEKFGGWPQSAKLTPVPTRHRVVSQGYRLDLPRAGRFSPEQARALGVPVRQWKTLQHGESITPEVDSSEPTYTWVSLSKDVSFGQRLTNTIGRSPAASITSCARLSSARLTISASTPFSAAARTASFCLS